MGEPDSSTWVLAKAERSGRPLLIRFRQFPNGLPEATYPKRISIFWTMSDPDVTGLPTDDEFDRLATFKDRLIAALEHDEHSILTLVLSHNGENEFIFYTADVAGFFERLTSISRLEEHYPTSTRQAADPDWSYFLSVIPEKVRPLIAGSDSTGVTEEPIELDHQDTGT
jgi:hypothetical protein